MDDADPRIGTVLQGRYRVLEALGVGGMGVVYRGERLGLNKPVAIKFLRGDMAVQDEFVVRFEREARAMSQLQHPHLIPVIDFGVVDATPYLVLEYVRGDNLYDVLRKGPMPVARALTIMRQVLAGLGHAHQQGIVHRDVKPDNVILADAEGTGDHAHLFDFGLAKLTGGGGENTSPAAAYAIGTPSYMSPEQARGEPVDVRSDVYACGVLLFEMLTGRKPFRGDNSRDVLRHHVKTPPPTLAEAAPDRTFSPELEAVVARALAKDPAERPADALAFAEELEPLALRASAAQRAVSPPAAGAPAVDDDAPTVARVAAAPDRDDAATPGAGATTRKRRSTWSTLFWVLVVMILLGGTAAGWLMYRELEAGGPGGPTATVPAATRPAPAPPAAATTGDSDGDGDRSGTAAAPTP